MAKSRLTPSKMQSFRALPKQVQQVCLDAASARYDKHYHPRNKHHKKHLAIDLLMGILLLSVFLFTVYLFAFYRNALIQEDVHLSLSLGNQQIQSGGELNFDLLIENNSNQTLTDARIEFPDHLAFTAVSSSPYPLNGRFVALNEIKSGQKISLHVRGYLLTGIESDTSLAAVLHIGKEYLGAAEKFISERIDVYDSTLTLDFEIPESIVANQEFDYTIHFGNSSPATNFENVTLIAKWPPGWELIESDPALVENTDYWNLESIGSLEQGQINGRAILRSDSLESAEITLEAFTSPAGAPYLQKVYETEIPIHYPNVDAQLRAVNGIAELGDTIQYSVEFLNQEEFALSNVFARLDLNLGLFQAPQYQKDDEGRFLVPMTENVDPGQRVTETFTLRLRDTVNPQLAFGDSAVAVRLSAELLYTAQDEQKIVLPLQSVSAAINSDLSGRAFARYFSAEGDQLGRGPVPPIVGETTKYWIFVHLNNQLHELEDVVVSGRLADGVDLSGRESVTIGESLQFNEATRFFIWRVGELPSYKTNFNQRSYGTAFEVTITPPANQVDQVLPLAESIEIQGRDKETGQIISVSLPNISTNLLFDSHATDDGRVRI